MTEIYKIVKGVPPPIMNSLSLAEFQSNKYNIRNFQVLSTDFRRTVNYGIETITNRAPSLQAKLPSGYKLAASLEEFKVKIKKWKCDTCPCRLCKKFQPNLVFVNSEYGLKIRKFALFFYNFFKKRKEKNYKMLYQYNIIIKISISKQNINIIIEKKLFI